MRRKNDDIVQNPSRLRVRVLIQSVDHLGQLSSTENLGRMQPPIDPDDRLAFLSKLLRFSSTHALRLGESAADLPVTVEVRVVRRRCDDRLELWAAVFRESEGVKHHSIGFVGELDDVLMHPLVVEKHIVSANFMCKKVLWRRDALLRGDRGDPESRQGCYRKDEQRASAWDMLQISGCASTKLAPCSIRPGPARLPDQVGHHRGWGNV